MDHINIMLEKAIHKPENPSSRASAACEEADDLGILTVPGEMYFSFIESLEACHARADLAHNIASHNCDPGCFIVLFHQSPELLGCLPDILNGHCGFAFLFHRGLDANLRHAADVLGYFLEFF